MTTDPAPFRRCPACSAEGLRFEDDKALRCEACGFLYFHNVAVAVAAVLVHEDRVLMTRRAHPPRAGSLDLPGGFVDPDESLEAALCRELAEELGIEVPVEAPRYLFSAWNRYPYAGVVYRTSDVYFSVRLDALPELHCADDVAEALWLTPREALDEELSFPTVGESLERLRLAGLETLP